jgi:hypothetical protein
VRCGRPRLCVPVVCACCGYAVLVSYVCVAHHTVAAWLPRSCMLMRSAGPITFEVQERSAIWKRIMMIGSSWAVLHGMYISSTAPQVELPAPCFQPGLPLHLQAAFQVLHFVVRRSLTGGLIGSGWQYHDSGPPSHSLSGCPLMLSSLHHMSLQAPPSIVCICQPWLGSDWVCTTLMCLQAGGPVCVGVTGCARGVRDSMLRTKNTLCLNAFGIIVELHRLMY